MRVNKSVSTERQMNKATPRDLLVMAIILSLAAFLRIYRLDTVPNGLLTDEAMRGYDAYSILHSGADSFGNSFPVFLRGYDDYTPGLYVYLTVPFIAILNLSAMSTRLAAAWIGVFTIALSYQVIRRPLGQTAALTGAFLLAISPWHIFLSRTGTEWNLLALGTTLTIVLAYRGLRHPRSLIAAGIAGGILLYGYAPIKAFLPILLVGYVALYWRQLYRQTRTAFIALLLFIIIAAPIYAFSFTSEGMNRLRIVYEGQNAPVSDTLPALIGNYFAYFSPRFLFEPNYRASDFQPPAATERLQSVGLHYWFEWPLILLGLVRLWHVQRKSAWFLLYWLIVAPVGINLHQDSPWSSLWLTSLPTLHALAGAGFAWLLVPMHQSSAQLTAQPRRIVRYATMSLLLALSLGNVGLMVHDLFYRFPVYGAPAWGYGRGPVITDMKAVKHQYDDVNYAAEDLPSVMYLLFYTRYDPAQRHLDLAKNPQQTWQNVSGYSVGRVERYIQQPGCHLVVTTVAGAEAIRLHVPQLVTLSRVDFPDGQPAFGLYAFATPSMVIERGEICGGPHSPAE